MTRDHANQVFKIAVALILSSNIARRHMTKGNQC